MYVKRGKNSKGNIIVGVSGVDEMLSQYERTKVAFKVDQYASDTISKGLATIGGSFENQFEFILSSLNDLPNYLDRLEHDSTKTPAHKALLGYEWAHKTFNQAEKSLYGLMEDLKPRAEEAKSKLFTSNAAVHPFDMAVMPLLVDSFKSEDFIMSRFALESEAQGRIALHLAGHFPSIGKPKIEGSDMDLQDLAIALNKEFTPQEQKYYDKIMETGAQINRFSIGTFQDVRRAVIPTNGYEQIKQSKVN